MPLCLCFLVKYRTWEIGLTADFVGVYSKKAWMGCVLDFSEVYKQNNLVGTDMNYAWKQVSGTEK